MNRRGLAPVADILKLLEPQAPAAAPSNVSPRAKGPRRKLDLVLAPNEISFAHGTGVLLTRLLAGAGPFATIRSWDNWGGVQAVNPVEDHVFTRDWEGRRDRAGASAFVATAVEDYDVGHILCLPYFEHDVHMAIAAKAATGAPMTVYVMDDNCLYNSEIAAGDLSDLFAVADALFAISPEMRTAYQNRFRRHFFVAPPVVADNLLRQAPSPQPPPLAAGKRRKVGLIGNIWHQGWLDLLMESARRTDIDVVWLSNADSFHWLKLPEADIRSGHLVMRHGLSTKEIVAALEPMPAVLVPSGNFEETGHALGISKLSLPSRMPFILATAGTPMIVLGHPDTGAARFVRRFDVGRVSAYDADMLADCLLELCDPEQQSRIRKRSFEIAPLFRSSGVYEMLRQAAVDGGAPGDERFEKAFSIPDKEFGYYVAPPPPRDVIPDQVDMVRAFMRLRAAGYRPDFVIDVGASSGIWSYTLYDVYPQARYLLIDPLSSRYSGRCLKPGFEVLECATGDHEGVAEFLVSRDLYGSSLIAVGGVDEQKELVRVPLRTIDGVAADCQLSGRGVLKLDVQFAEHLVLKGATQLLDASIDIIVIEVTLFKLVPDMLDMRGIVDLVAALGFDYFDEVGEWREPATGRLEQKDILFTRRGLLSPR